MSKVRAHFHKGESAYSHKRNSFSRQTATSLDHEIDGKWEESPEVKLARRRAIVAIQKESIDKEWALRRSAGANSMMSQHYEQVVFAPAKLTKRGEESE